jgi:hypothetical protein
MALSRQFLGFWRCRILTQPDERRAAICRNVNRFTFVIRRSSYTCLTTGLFSKSGGGCNA